tara:strand:- start:352 stop:1335 length:984 start_codon:yes stop_codon:yes gene_type:complete
MNKKILIYNSGGGLGDSIQLFPLILSLQNHFKKSDFYYLGAHENHYLGKLKEYNISIKTLNLGLKYFGFRWWHLFVAKKNFLKLKLDEFDLIVDCQSKLRNTIILKQIPSKSFYSSTFNNIFCSGFHNSINKFISDFHGVYLTISHLKFLLASDFETINYDIKKMPKKYLEESKRLLPDKNYIGFSLTQGNVYRKKSWPLDNFIIVAKQLIGRGKKIVFFVEKSEKQLIENIKAILPEAIFPEQNSDITSPLLVTALASRLEKVITIDNGVMHMVALAKTPIIALFGPTNPKKFAPNQKNIKILDSKEMYGVKDVSKIKANDVLKSL